MRPARPWPRPHCVRRLGKCENFTRATCPQTALTSTHPACQSPRPDPKDSQQSLVCAARATPRKARSGHAGCPERRVGVVEPGSTDDLPWGQPLGKPDGAKPASRPGAQRPTREGRFQDMAGSETVAPCMDARIGTLSVPIRTHTTPPPHHPHHPPHPHRQRLSPQGAPCGCAPGAARPTPATRA